MEPDSPEPTAELSLGSTAAPAGGGAASPGAVHLGFDGFDSAVGGLEHSLPPGLFGEWPLAPLRQDGAAGRSVVAARRLEQQELVLRAEPFATAVMAQQRKRVCSVCLAHAPQPTGWKLRCGCAQDFYCR